MITAQSQIQSQYYGRIKPIPVVTVCYWLMMLITGTDIWDACLLTVAVAFGLMSVTAGGGIKTVPGLLNFVLILKFILIAVVLKTVTFQAADSNLRAPRTTAWVMAVGFFGLYIGTVIFRYVTKIKGVVKGVNDAGVYLWLTIVFSIACLGSMFLVLMFQNSYEDALLGGFWGIAHQFETTASFCIVPAMYYAWSSGSKKFMSHPLVLSIFIANLALGLAATTKQGLMEPVLCYLSVGFIRYGFRSKAVWSIMAAGGFFYVSIVYPYSQYVRSHGGRNGTFSERLEAIQEVFFSVATDSSFRQSVDSQVSNGDSYLGRQSLEPISRLAMMGEADRLIAATDETQSYTGWDTIVNGLELMVPRFIADLKPGAGVGNILGHIGGELAPDDFSTQISYGFMANLYNAFGLNGVLIGTIIFMAIFYYVIRLWFGESDLTLTPWGGSIWYLLMGLCFEHGLVEGPVANDLPAFINLSATVGLIFISIFLASFFGNRRTRIF